MVDLMEVIMMSEVFDLSIGAKKASDIDDHIWERLSEQPSLDTSFMLQYHSHLNWDKISVFHDDFSTEDYEKLSPYLNWGLIVTHRMIPDYILNKYYNEFAQ